VTVTIPKFTNGCPDIKAPTAVYCRTCQPCQHSLPFCPFALLHGTGPVFMLSRYTSFLIPPIHIMTSSKFVATHIIFISSHLISFILSHPIPSYCIPIPSRRGISPSAHPPIYHPSPPTTVHDPPSRTSTPTTPSTLHIPSDPSPPATLERSDEHELTEETNFCSASAVSELKLS
jgi:hypothetical protein